MNETLSPRQAYRIVEEANNISMNAVHEMETKNDVFVKKLSDIWEDNNAVDFAQKHKNNMETAIQQLSDNTRVFADAVEGIANSYAKVGNMQSISVERIKISGSINVESIKEHFDDGNGDDFGFKNPKSGPDQAMEAFEELKTALARIAHEAVDRINSLPAFGNLEVQGAIASSAGLVIHIFEDLMKSAEALMREHLEQTSKAYTITGQNAIHSARIGQ